MPSIIFDAPLLFGEESGGAPAPEKSCRAPCTQRPAPPVFGCRFGFQQRRCRGARFLASAFGSPPRRGRLADSDGLLSARWAAKSTMPCAGAISTACGSLLYAFAGAGDVDRFLQSAAELSCHCHFLLPAFIIRNAMPKSRRPSSRRYINSAAAPARRRKEAASFVSAAFWRAAETTP